MKILYLPTLAQLLDRKCRFRSHAHRPIFHPRLTNLVYLFIKLLTSEIQFKFEKIVKKIIVVACVRVLNAFGIVGEGLDTNSCSSSAMEVFRTSSEISGSFPKPLEHLQKPLAMCGSSWNIFGNLGNVETKISRI